MIVLGGYISEILNTTINTDLTLYQILVQIT